MGGELCSLGLSSLEEMESSASDDSLEVSVPLRFIFLGLIKGAELVFGSSVMVFGVFSVSIKMVLRADSYILRIFLMSVLTFEISELVRRVGSTGMLKISEIRRSLTGEEEGEGVMMRM